MPRRNREKFPNRANKKVERQPNKSNRKIERRPKRPDTITPIDRRKEEVVDFFSKNESCVLTAHTGAGKTTRGPEFLLEALGPDAKIAVTVPRKGIATSVATYVAERGGHTLGKKVGYQIRHDARVKAETALNFMTDGIMLRKLTQDPLLKDYDAVMVDEAHERSLNIDLTMGLLKQAQEKRKAKGLEPLKVIISSATIEKEKFADYFNTEATMEVEGKMFPVKESYMDYNPNNYVKAAAEQCKNILEMTNEVIKDDGNIAGDILVFMPSKKAIANTIQEIRTLEIASDFEVFPFHAQVSAKERKEILSKRSTKRRIVVSTNVAEAGVTIPDVGYVVDSGLIRENEYNPESGIESLEEKEHSLAGLKQRRGRAGRITEGEYYGLYTKDSLNERKAYSDPEIQRSDLSGVILAMKKAGISDVHNFDFLDHPGIEKIDAAVQNLKILGALDEAGDLTSIGEKMADLPTDPKIGRALIAAAESGCAGNVATIAAFLTEGEREAKDIHEQFQDPSSDFLSMLNVWNAYDKQRGKRYKGRERGAGIKSLSGERWQHIEKTRSQFLEALKKADIQQGSSHNIADIGKSITAGFISNLMIKNGYNRWERAEYTPVYGHKQTNFKIDKKSAVDTSPEVCVAQERRRINFEEEGGIDLLCIVQHVDPNWIPEVAPQMVEEHSSEIVYNPEADLTERHVSRRIKGTSYDLPPATESDIPREKQAEAFAQYAVEDPYEDFAEENKHNFEIASQYNNLRLRYGGDIEDNRFFAGECTQETVKQLYGKIFKGNKIYSMKDLNRNKINLHFALSDFVPKDVQELIKEENPESITIADKEYPITYEEKTLMDMNPPSTPLLLLRVTTHLSSKNLQYFLLDVR